MWRSNLARPSSKLSKKRPQPLWKWKPTTWTSDLLSPIPVHPSLFTHPCYRLQKQPNRHWICCFVDAIRRKKTNYLSDNGVKQTTSNKQRSRTKRLLGQTYLRHKRATSARVASSVTANRTNERWCLCQHQQTEQRSGDGESGRWCRARSNSL